MKKCLCLLLTAALLLTGCGREKPGAAPDPAEERDLAVDQDTGEWNGQGGSYALEDLDAPEGSLAAVLCRGELCTLTQELGENFMGYSIWRGGEKVYSTTAIVTGGAPSEEGIWLCEYAAVDGAYKHILSLISPAGEELRTVDLGALYPAESYGSLCQAGGQLFIPCGGEALLVLSEAGESVCTLALPEASCYPVASEGGQVYAVEETEQGNRLYLADLASENLCPAFSCGPGTVFDGGEGNFLLLGSGEGLYALTAEGEQTPLVLWRECALPVNGLAGALPLEDGRFLLQLSTGLRVLTPVDPAALHPKTRLTLAGLHGGDGLERDIAAFNSASPDYYVEVLDYSDGGTYSEDAALTRLNTEILSGKAPDMLSFRFLSPMAYIGKGLLTDLTPFFGRDGGPGLEDIAISRALSVGGGIYFIGSAFSVPTVLARYADFGDRTGWTVDEYLALDAARGPGEGTLYNLTRESFLEEMAARWLPAAMDWETMTCSFDSPAFTALLEAALRVRETPEDPNNMDYTPGPVKVANGSLVGAAVLLDNVTALAQAEAQAGCRLSAIGWPTPDGSCGSQIELKNPVGILAQSPHQEGCWAFIRFMLENADPNDGFSLPAALPALREKISLAQAEEAAPVHLTQEDGERLLALIAGIDSTRLPDETVMQIIREETAAMLAGDKTPEDAARLIQSRAGVYMAEQG